ncbi:hypothetical protein [Roseobacter ponti]|uniref:Uncharacterized protein n=1 Tax=Roseobacter ponti TaxID=1891787 RepID=A0A858SRJ8_9RHOB|nr:hypothetical protein [Roseobacter ponti]QJF50617.1 hypothetical protein G3256_05315 [Roseobacter ponti]
MSKPVTNSQVEDVLSSIRRLVSDNKKNSGSAGVVPVQDKLVLTPQLRVSEDSSEHEAEVADLNGAPQGPTSDSTDFHSPASDEDATDVTPADAPVDAPLQLSPEMADDALEGFDGYEEPLPDQSAEQETGGDGGFVFARRRATAPEARAPQQAGADAGPARKETPASENTSGSSRVSEADARSHLSEKIAALETAIARTADQWEPDGNGRDAYAGTRAPSMDWQDGVSFDGKGAPLSDDDPIEPVATVEGDTDVSWSEEDQIIDEAALRLLVGDIVRSELQGELGERITRNVRRLVHREIMRALAARDLD